MPDSARGFVYRPDQAPREIRLEEVSEFIGDSQNFIWIDIPSPDQRQLHLLGEELGLHELALEDALTTHQRPKVDEYTDHLFLSCKTASPANGGFQLGELHLFIGQNFFTVIRHGSAPDLLHARERLCRPHNGHAPGRGAALYFALDEIVDQYKPVIASVNAHFHQLEELLLDGRMVRDDMERLYTVKRELTALRNVIDPMQAVVLELIRMHPDIVTKELKAYYRDVHDHVLRAMNAIDLLRASALDAMQFHMATLTLKQNESVRKLAGWGAILAVPTVIFSLYGMNFKEMPELNWPWGYPLVVLGTLSGAYWLYRRLKKRGWI